jgi:serine/threonine protein kinase
MVMQTNSGGIVKLVEPAPLPEGPTLPQVPGYTLLEELGRGGVGVVYKARHEPLKRIVALKMLLSGADSRLPNSSRFTAEAEAVARLRHPHIVQIYEIGVAEQGPYLALEYISQGNLRDHIHGKPQPARAAAQLVEILARAIHHAHERGVLHRDLKPANVMLDAPTESKPDMGVGEDALRLFGVPKISDFGLAKRFDLEGGLTRHGEILGTPYYMAPEQAQGQRAQVGPPTDVYALGAILYELLAGRPPFDSQDLVEVLRALVFQPPTPPRQVNPQIPVDLEVVCLKCLEKDPAQRYSSAQALAEDLAHFLRGEPVLARSPAPQSRRTNRMRMALQVLAMVLPVSGAWFAYSLYASSQAAEAARREAEAALCKQEEQWAMAEVRDQVRTVKQMLTVYGVAVGGPARVAAGEPRQFPLGAGWGFVLPAADKTSKNQDVTIPVPFTFAALFGDRFKEDQAPLKFTIYSKYPFPGRTHVLDEWRRSALEQLSASPESEGDVSKQEIMEVNAHGRKLRRLRYAEVIRMVDQKCVDCHNTHSRDWGGKTWAQGQVRALIEITRDLDH